MSYETDRMQFIGRGRTVGQSQAMHGGRPPRSREARDQCSIPSVASAVGSRSIRNESVDGRYGVRRSVKPVTSVCASSTNIRIGVSPIASSIWHGPIARSCCANSMPPKPTRNSMDAWPSSIIYANASLRADRELLIKNRRGQSGLWGYAISGDLPIVLLQIGDPANIDLVRQLVQAHAYWRSKGLAVDLVIWNEDHAGYRQYSTNRSWG